MKLDLRYCIPFGILLFLVSCKERVSQEQLINSALEIKLAQWREEQIASCNEKILMDAEQYADSVLVATSLEAKLDTIGKPAKPIKPLKPEFKEKPDSVIVEEIYKKGG